MLFTVNTEVCTRCGLCVADCPTGLLVMSDDGPITCKGGCISCGHCISVCPTLALDSDLTPRKEQIDITQEPKLTPEQAELFLLAVAPFVIIKINQFLLSLFARY